MKGTIEEMEEIGFDESCERTWTCEGEELGVGGRTGKGCRTRDEDEERV